MKLKSPDMLRALMDARGLGYGSLAELTGLSKGFISHLAKGRKVSCRPTTAERIALALGVEIHSLFEVHMSTSTGQNANQNRRAA